MYESYFSMTAAPFGLNPDPDFYFGSRGHSNALAYLKFGVFQREGFIVVTGEIGTGKTMLVRTLLGALDPDKVVAAQIVSTQLEAGDLLRAVATSFGVSSKGLNKAELIATIEAFLMHLVTQERSALLIVDEAQNLGREAIEELRMLSNFQLGSKALLQSFLVGQPELRVLLADKSMEQFRQRIIASCHLGPMDLAETKAYVLHRLQRVGWDDRPRFEAEAFEQIFKSTGGVPRRINLLCNRLLLAVFLASADGISATMVETTAAELRSEVGGPLQPAALSETEVEPSRAAASKAAADIVAGTMPLVSFAADSRGPILCIAGSRADELRLAPLVRALRAQRVLPSALLVRIGNAQEVAGVGEAFTSLFELDDAVVPVVLEGSAPRERLLEAMQRIQRVVQLYSPSAIAVCGGSEQALAASLTASRHACKLIRIDGGLRSLDLASIEESNGQLMDRLADAIYVSDSTARESLEAENIVKARAHFVGSLQVDTLTLALPNRVSPGYTLQRAALPVESILGKHGFGLVVIRHAQHLDDPRQLTDLLKLLQAISREAPLLWSIEPPTRASIDRHGAGDLLRNAWVSFLPPLGYLEYVGLLFEARFAITDSWDVQEESAAIGVPCLSFGAAGPRRITIDHGSNTYLGQISSRVDRSAWQPILDAPRGGKPPKLWDGSAAERLVEHLASVINVRTAAPIKLAAVPAA